MCSSTDCNSPEAKDVFYQKLSQFIPFAPSVDIVAAVDVFYFTKPGYFDRIGRHIRERFPVPTDPTDNSGHPIQGLSDPNSLFKVKSACLTYSFVFTAFDSKLITTLSATGDVHRSTDTDLAFVRAPICLLLAFGHTSTKSTCSAKIIADGNRTFRCQSEL